MGLDRFLITLPTLMVQSTEVPALPADAPTPRDDSYAQQMMQDCGN